MTIFALHSTGKSAGVAVLQDGIFLYHACLQAENTHSETLLPLCLNAFAVCGLSPAAIGVYALAAGPGSFTGVRIGLATVKGLALPHGTPVAAVSTLWAAAAGCEMQGTIVPALDARRGEVYWAAFEKSEEGLFRLEEDSAGPVASLEALVKNCKKPLYFVGDGATLCYTAFKDEPGVQLYSSPLPHLALGVALCGQKLAQTGLLQPAASVQPAYLRLSQAEREAAQKAANMH